MVHSLRRDDTTQARVVCACYMHARSYPGPSVWRRATVCVVCLSPERSPPSRRSALRTPYNGRLGGREKAESSAMQFRHSNLHQKNYIRLPTCYPKSGPALCQSRRHPVRTHLVLRPFTTATPAQREADPTGGRRLVVLPHADFVDLEPRGRRRELPACMDAATPPLCARARKGAVRQASAWTR